MILIPKQGLSGKQKKTEGFLENVKKDISKIFIPKDKLKVKIEEQITFIKKDKPFEDIIGPYEIEDLSGKNAKSGTAFKLIDADGKWYKLRTAESNNEAKQISRIINETKSAMPGYLGRREIAGRVYHLFKRLENAKEIKDFKYDYKNKDNEQEPDEIHKKAGKVLGKVNAKNMHTNGSVFTEEFNIRTKKINKSRLYRNKIFALMPKIAKMLNQDKKVFSQKEKEDIQIFFKEHMKHENIRFGYDLWDAHGGNFMLEEQNPHVAYAIDEGSIKADHLIGTGIGHYIDIKNITDEGIKKFLKGYYKKNPDIHFDKKYFEFIYATFCLKKIQSRIRMTKNIENKNIRDMKKKLLETMEYAKNDKYICKNSAINRFVDINENIRKKITT